MIHITKTLQENNYEELRKEFYSLGLQLFTHAKNMELTHPAKCEKFSKIALTIGEISATLREMQENQIVKK